MITPATFAQASDISKELAQRVLDICYEKELDACDLNTVLWRMKDWIMANKMADLLDAMGDDEIGSIVDQMILERQMWQNQCPQSVYNAKDDEQLETAFNDLGKPESAWLFSTLVFKEKKTYAEGDVVDIQIMRVGKWQHPAYGEVEIKKSTINDVVSNFKERKRGIELAVDENHEPNHKALGWFKELYTEEKGKALFAKIELTAKGAELINEGAYKYFSPEIQFMKTDEETGETIRNLLVGGAFTNRPFFKAMQPLMAAEGASDRKQMQQTGQASPQSILFFSNSKPMKRFLELLAAFAELDKISKTQGAELETAFNEIPEAHRHDELKAKFAEALEKVSEGGDEETPAAPPADVPKDESVKANEDGTFTVTKEFVQSVQGMQSNLSKMQRSLRFNETKELITKLQFSEANPTGVVLPKDISAISEFAVSLSEQQSTAFLKIISNLKSLTGEKGHGDGGNGEFGEADPEAVKFFMEKMGQDKDTAMKSALDAKKNTKK